MKNLLSMAVVCLSLVGCVANTDSTPTVETGKTVSTSGEYKSYYRVNDEQTGCNKTSYVHTEVDGHSFWVQVPTLCNPQPSIFKGDPTPDVGDPYEENDGPVTEERILEIYYAQSIAASRADRATYKQER